MLSAILELASHFFRQPYDFASISLFGIHILDLDSLSTSCEILRYNLNKLHSTQYSPAIHPHIVLSDYIEKLVGLNLNRIFEYTLVVLKLLDL